MRLPEPRKEISKVLIKNVIISFQLYFPQVQLPRVNHKDHFHFISLLSLT